MGRGGAQASIFGQGRPAPQAPGARTASTGLDGRSARARASARDLRGLYTGAVQLYLIRHAEAEDAAAGGADSDSARRLTDDGRKRFRRVARGLAELDVVLDHLHTSPLVRAVETAELLADLVEGPTSAERTLAEPPGEALLALLAAHPDESSVACVGHEPWLGELAGMLCTPAARDGADARGLPALELDKGGVIALAGRPRAGGMRLAALYPARVLRRLRKLA